MARVTKWVPTISSLPHCPSSLSSSTILEQVNFFGRNLLKKAWISPKTRSNWLFRRITFIGDFFLNSLFFWTIPLTNTLDDLEQKCPKHEKRHDAKYPNH